MAHQRYIVQEENVIFEEKGDLLPSNVPIHIAVANYVWKKAEDVNCQICLESKFNALTFLPEKREITETEDWLSWIFQFHIHADDAHGAAASPHSGWFAVYDKVPKMLRQTKDGKMIRVPVGEGWSDDPEDSAA